MGMSTLVYYIMKILVKKADTSIDLSSLDDSVSDIVGTSSIDDLSDVLSIIVSSDDTICEPMNVSSISSSVSTDTVTLNQSIELVRTEGKTFLVIDKKNLYNTLARIRKLTKDINKNIVSSNSSSNYKLKQRKNCKVNMNTFGKTLIRGKNAADIIEDNII